MGAKRFLGLTFPIVVLLGVWSVLVFLNYQPGTWLIGWDNLLPELNFPLNIHRSLLAAWQEYQGLGLLGGMGHAADLPRQLILWAASLVVPLSFLRYGWTFLMLLIGPLGVFYLVKNLWLHDFDEIGKNFGALSGGVFYLLNLATVQNFYTPFEAFTSFYGFLPWLVYSLLRVLKKPKKKNLLVFVGFSIVAAPLGYVETMFLVYGIVVGIFLIGFVAQRRKRLLNDELFGFEHHPFHKRLLIGLAVVSTIFATNAYWLLPTGYFALTRGADVAKARINQLSSPDTALQNKASGQFYKVALLRGFWFDYVDRQSDGKFGFLMPEWRDHLANPATDTMGYVLFGLVVIGVVYGWVKRLPWVKSFTVILVLGFLMLTNDNPPLGWLYNFISDKIPLFEEVFRNPYTKWSVVTAFSFSVFFSVGALFVVDLFAHIFRRAALVATGFSLGFLFLGFLGPSFRGYLISPSMRQKIPTDYFQVFDFFKKQGPSGRIANFPQDTFWGWKYYGWGNRGSGFLWYGIEQPILDRAFDVWNIKNENYYQEVSAAVYRQDKLGLEQVFKKYGVQWILVDRNVVAASDQQNSLYVSELEKMLSQNVGVDLAGNFGKIDIYKYSGGEVTNSTRLSSGSNQIGRPIGGMANDSLYADLGDYWTRITNASAIVRGSGQTFDYPYADLATWQATVLTDTGIDFVTTGWGREVTAGDKIIFPNYVDSESVVPAEIWVKTDSGVVGIEVKYLLPRFYVSGNLISDFSERKRNFSIPITNPSGLDLLLSVNGKDFFTMPPTTNVLEKLGTTELSTRAANSFRIYSLLTQGVQTLSDKIQGAPVTDCYGTGAPGSTFGAIPIDGGVTLSGVRSVPCIEVPLGTQSAGGEVIRVHFVYRSSLDERPEYVVLDTANRQRLNANQRGSYSSDWEVYYDNVEVLDGNSGNLSLQLVLDASGSTTEKQISYRDVQVSEYAKLGENTLGTNDLQGDLFQGVPVTISRDGGLSVAIPKVDSWMSRTENVRSHGYSALPTNCNQFTHGIYDRQIVGDGEEGSYLKYKARDANTCDYWDLRWLPENASYAISLQTKTIQGRPPLICLENNSSHRCDIYSRLTAGNDWHRSVFVNPAMGNGLGYGLHFYTDSIGSDWSETDLKHISVSPIPLVWLSRLVVGRGELVLEQRSSVKPSGITRLSEAMYSGKVSVGEDGEILVLNQTYDGGWDLIWSGGGRGTGWADWGESLFVPTFASEHVLVNNWANGWRLSKGDYDVAIIYYPQYLEFLGFMTLAAYFYFWFWYAGPPVWIFRKLKGK